MNIPALEAADDLRHLMAVGSMFAGKEGRDYIDHLQELAWFDDPEAIESGQQLLDVADAKRSNGITPRTAPNPTPDLPA